MCKRYGFRYACGHVLTIYGTGIDYKRCPPQLENPRKTCENGGGSAIEEVTIERYRPCSGDRCKGLYAARRDLEDRWLKALNSNGGDPQLEITDVESWYVHYDSMDTEAVEAYCGDSESAS